MVKLLQWMKVQEIIKKINVHNFLTDPVNGIIIITTVWEASLFFPWAFTDKLSNLQMHR